MWNCTLASLPPRVPIDSFKKFQKSSPFQNRLGVYNGNMYSEFFWGAVENSHPTGPVHCANLDSACVRTARSSREARGTSKQDTREEGWDRRVQPATALLLCSWSFPLPASLTEHGPLTALRGELGV